MGGLSKTMKQTSVDLICEEIKRRQLPDDFMDTVSGAYLTVATEIARRQHQKNAPMMVSFNGAQGSGKSTITAFLCLLLRTEFKLSVCDVSIDDFYLTAAQRQQLAENVHPLLKTRGVPGTHDMELARKTLSALMHGNSDEPVLIPVFDKAVDDRADITHWKNQQQPIDVVLFEGWCNHAPVERDKARLAKPINELEHMEDPKGIWRQYVNEALASYHEELFQFADMLIFLRVPSFEKVYEWRALQEEKLAATAMNPSAVMDASALKRFIQHYERITRRCLDQLPALANIVIELADNHAITDVKVRKKE